MKTYEYLKLWVLTALRHRENLNPQSDMRRSVRNAPENSSRIPVFICVRAALTENAKQRAGCRGYVALICAVRGAFEVPYLEPSCASTPRESQDFHGQGIAH